MRIFKGKDSEKGASAIEFALLLPLLLLIFYGMIVYFNLLMVNRRIDMAANDIAAVLAKEGRVAPNFVNVTACGYTYKEYRGGRAAIDDIVRTMMPIIIYPLNYRNGAQIPLNFQYNVSMAGIPLWTKISSTPPAGGTNNLRLMWQVIEGASFGPTVTGPSFSYSAISSDELFTADNQGRAYIAVAVRYPFLQSADYTASLLNGAEIGGLTLAGGNKSGKGKIDFKSFGQAIVKEAAYPVRPTVINAAGNYIPYNDMNICTDCDVNSMSVSPKCKNGCTDFEFDTNISGCSFD